MKLDAEELERLSGDPQAIRTKVRSCSKGQLIDLLCGVLTQHWEQFLRHWRRTRTRGMTRTELNGEPLAYVIHEVEGGASLEDWDQDPNNRTMRTNVDAVDDVVRVTFVDETHTYCPLFRIVLDKEGALRLADALNFAVSQAEGDTLAEYAECASAPKAEARLRKILYEEGMDVK